MRSRLPVLAAALVAAVVAAPASATAAGVVLGDGTVTPALDASAGPRVTSWSMLVTGRGFTCAIDIVEPLGTYAAGAGPAWVECGGMGDVHAQCVATRAGLTFTLACAELDDGTAVLRVTPHGDPLRFGTYDVEGVLAFA